MTRSNVQAMRPGRARSRLRLETLEDRTVPSTFTVLNALDNGSVGSLRWAVGQANSHLGADTIDFNNKLFSTPQTITLSGYQLELSDTSGATSITGPAAGVIVNSGYRSRVFQVDELVTALISGLTITGGNSGYGSGGALLNGGTTTLSHCTITASYAYRGGGLFNSGSLTLNNCTVSGNSAVYSIRPYYYFGYGGGVANDGTATLTNCTVSGNGAASSGGGMYNRGTSTLINTIVAGNWGGDLDGSLAMASSNNLIGGDPLLAPLGNYGGTAQTMPLLPGSPAIDAGTSGAGIPTTDQRGLSRVGAVDIGAFESQGFNFKVVPGGTPQTANIGTAFAHPLAVSVSANNSVEPVDGGRVSFVAHPAANGAAAIFSPSSPVIASGQAATTAVPNNFLGSYTVAPRAGGGSSATFTLTNTGTPFAALVVNTTSDALTPGAGLLSLREAIAFSNTSPSGNSPITFDSGYGHLFYTPQTITLTGAQFELSNTSGTATITGPPTGVTVDGGRRSRVFQVDAMATASISGMTITGGFSGYGNGGGLLNFGTTTLTNCTVSGNSALAFNRGGGVSNFGTATLTDCTVSGNSATSGGGLSNSGTATLSHCTVSGNSAASGGGLSNSGTATLTRCTVSGNSAYSYGGGLANFGTATLTSCTISVNSADFGGGGVSNFGTATLTDCTISGNSAGPFGGGLFNSGLATMTLTNCTVSGNSVGYSGGGLFDYGTATLTNCTVSGNQAYEGGGVYNFGTARLINTIVARNWGGDLEGSLAAASSNNLIGGDPLLAPLGNYGGAGQTMPLLPGSPAIDAGTSGADIPTTDQRGSGRVGAIDIGAFESQGFNFKVVPGGTPQTANIGTAFAHPLAVSVSANNPVEPVDGGRVSFVAHPAANGATAIIVSSTPVIAGRPVAVTAVPNNVLGSYTVVARAGGDSSATFTLTNTGTPFAALVVNTTSDALAPGAGLLSLREAIAFNNTSPSGNSPINFDGGYGHLFYTPQTITLTGAQLELSNTSGTATIIGPTVSVTVSGGGLSRVFQVDELVTASIYGMTITGAFSGYDSGGGLNNLGTTTLTNCTVSGNTAYYGGGLANFGTATLIHCTVGGNSAIAFNRGGGVSNFGTATLTDCIVSGNSAASGGGLSNSGTATLSHCTVSGNSAHDGGGLFNIGTATLTDCTVSGNLAVTDGGGLLNLGSATLTSCTISGNHGGRGGGLRNSGTATLNVTSSTIANNQATSQGGGISTTSGSVILTNSVISSNQVNSSGIALGGGIDCENSKLSLTNCTVSANLTNGTTALGGGIYSFNSSVILRYCVITANQANGSVLGEGGGIYSFNSDLNLLTSIVIGNKATTDFDDIFVGP